MVKFSNPRKVAEFDDWPSGSQRVKCKFEVEHSPKKGYRVSRTTQKNGVWCKPKLSTYSKGSAAIVDGDDGKTYILQASPEYGMIVVMTHDFMNAVDEGDHPLTAHDSTNTDSARYHELLKLANSAV